jgi:hypothetical protein
MTKPDLPSIDYLRQRLRYDPDTGKLFWLNLGAMPTHLRASYGEAFTSRGGSGYLQGKINGRTFVAHRVIWVNPHRGDAVVYVPASLGMIVADPYIDEVHSGHNLASLERLANRLAKVG